MTAVLMGERIAVMASLGERLQQVMVMRAISASKLSLDAGLSRTAVQKIIDRGGARTSSETISKLAAAAQVDRDWLESGRGEPTLPTRPDLRLEREPEHVPADDEVPLETAALRVMDRDRHTLRRAHAHDEGRAWVRRADRHRRRAHLPARAGLPLDAKFQHRA